MAATTGGERPDKRETTQLRAISATLGVLERTDGSAKLHWGNTVVIAAVYGPTDIKPQKEIIDQANVEVILKPSGGIGGCKEKQQEHYITEAVRSIALVNMYPRAGISIIIQVINDDGSLLSTACTATCLALIDSGMPMKATLVGISCALTPLGTLILDPNFEEQQTATATFAFSIENSSSKDLLHTSYSMGIFSEENFFAAHALATQAAQVVFKFVRDCVENKISKLAIQ